MIHISFRAPWVRAAALATAFVALSGCNVRDTFLSPQQPGTILPGDISSAGPAGAEAIRVGALGRFQQLTPGGGNGNQTEATLLGDLLADVWKSGDTFTQHNETDQRAVSTNNSVLSTAYSDLNRSRGFYRDAINAISTIEPDKKAEVAEQYFVMGYSEMLLGELFCNGIPLSQTVNGAYVYTQPLTDQQVFAVAITHLDSALTLAAAQGGTVAADLALAKSIANAAAVAKGRTLVDMGNFSAAATAVASVPTNYTYNVTFSQATNDNNVWGLAGQVSTRARFVVSDSFDTQGIVKNALPFSSAKDPRVPTTGSPTANGTKAIDGTTPLVFQMIWLNRFDPIPVATGIDARLIEAEAKLNVKTPQGIADMMTILNALRTSPQILGPLSVPAMAALPMPATQDDATSLFFREKAFWQFGRGNRLGDLRRLIRQYGRTQDNVFPTGKFHKSGGASYGTDVNLPVTDNEKTNPNFKGCIDRNA